MSLLIAWLLAAASVALAVLLSFAGSMCAVPRFPWRQRLAVLGLAGFASAAAVWAWREHGVGAAIGPLVLVAFALLVALAPTTRRGSSLAAVTRTSAKRADGSTWFVDDEHNRRLTTQDVERALAAERAGAPPPGGAASWDAHWRQYEAGLMQWQQNGADYVARVRAQRAAAGTQRAAAGTHSTTPNARQ